VFIPLAGFIRTAHPLIDWLLPGVFLRHHRHLLLSVSFHASHHVNYAKCRMSNHGVTNVGALATFPDTALHLRSLPGVQVHMTRAPAFTVPLPLLLPQLHVKTHHPRLMRNGNVPGANVWHGCARRSIIHRNPASAASHIPTHVSLPPPAPPCPTGSNPGPTQVSSLQKAVDSLNSQCASLAARLNTTEARFDAVESRFGILAAPLANISTKLATNDTTLKSLLEAQQVIIASVTSLTDKLDSLATRFETVTAPTVELVSRGSPRNNNLPTPPTSSGSRKHRSNVH